MCLFFYCNTNIHIEFNARQIIISCRLYNHTDLKQLVYTAKTPVLYKKKAALVHYETIYEYYVLQKKKKQFVVAETIKTNFMYKYVKYSLRIISWSTEHTITRAVCKNDKCYSYLKLYSPRVEKKKLFFFF